MPQCLHIKYVDDKDMCRFDQSSHVRCMMMESSCAKDAKLVDVRYIEEDIIIALKKWCVFHARTPHV